MPRCWTTPFELRAHLPDPPTFSRGTPELAPRMHTIQQHQSCVGGGPTCSGLERTRKCWMSSKFIAFGPRGVLVRPPGAPEGRKQMCQANDTCTTLELRKQNTKMGEIRFSRKHVTCCLNVVVVPPPPPALRPPPDGRKEDTVRAQKLHIGGTFALGPTPPPCARTRATTKQNKKRALARTPRNRIMGKKCVALGSGSATRNPGHNVRHRNYPSRLAVCKPDNSPTNDCAGTRHITCDVGGPGEADYGRENTVTRKLPKGCSPCAPDDA